MIDPTKNLRNLSIKHPDKHDVAELAPTFVLLAVFLATRNHPNRSVSVLLPAFAALGAWLLLKGLRYVPR